MQHIINYVLVVLRHRYTIIGVSVRTNNIILLYEIYTSDVHNIILLPIGI